MYARLPCLLLATVLIGAAMSTAEAQTAPGGTVVLRGSPPANSNVGRIVPSNQPTPAPTRSAGSDDNYDANFDRSHDSSGMDRRFDGNYDTSGFDRHFDRP